MNRRAIVNVWGAEYSLGPRKILRGVDLTLRPGEIYGLLGASGAGKSALVGAICGRLKLTGGEVAVDGRDPRNDPAARAVLGLVPRKIALYERLTVSENLRAFGWFAGVRGRALREAVDLALRLTGARDRQHLPVRRLSDDDRRRASIAAAILHRPRLLVLDEPAAGMDAGARETLDAVIRTLREAGMAVLIVTRDLDHAAGLADRVGVLRQGRKLLEGAPGTLVAQAFGEEMEVLVHLAEAPDAIAESLLSSEGLARAGKDAIVWSRFDAEAHAIAERLDRRLREAGLATRKIEVRPPSLRSLLRLVADWREAA